MFRDRDRELERLQAQLLEEEESAASKEQEADFLDEETVDALLEDGDQTRDPEAYENFSNGYGRMPDSARVYNGDKVDVELEEYAREVCAPEKKSGCTGFLVVLLLMMLAILGCMVWLYWRMGGFSW